MDRRRFLQLGAASPLLLGLGSVAGEARAQQRQPGNAGSSGNGKARNVIFLVSDGMSMGTLTAADQYLYWRDERHTHWIDLYMQRDLPVHRGLMDMSSRNAMVTDSAAAAASWGCGHRVNNGSVNIGPDDEEYPTILQIAREAGKATGLVTTTTVTHATPAGFGANVASRGQEADIAKQYYERGYDVILGGGNHYFDPERRDDGEDLYGKFEQAGHEIIRDRDALLALSDSDVGVLGTFSNWHLPYEIDRLHNEQSKQSVPTLAEMTDAALQRLNRIGDGFVLQVEGGRVDHAAHGNDLGGLLFDQLAFDDAIGVALAFQQEHPDTLVIITTDHGNANPGFQAGPDLGHGQFEKLSRFKGTGLTHIVPELNEEVSRDTIRDRFKETLELEISDRETDMIYDFVRGDYELPYHRTNHIRSLVAKVVANHLDFNWIGRSHSADYVELAATGPGAEQVGPFTKNTDLHQFMLKALGIEAVQEAANRRGVRVFA
ncbi:alkaline phosphatase [Phycisphaerales bacterium AB-hyl4]|uniref:Alkaline phosphatase n=1 Tax=Natronomicrosphaera hydrolytica TaxID=3242702 RepID=A0ABV4U484_9BACT